MYKITGMFKSPSPNCERIGKSHEYEVIDIQHIDSAYADLMIMTIPIDPIDDIEDYSTLVYQCPKCLHTRMIDMLTETAEIEIDNYEKGKIGTTGM
jgi:hypothetical protein